MSTVTLPSGARMPIFGMGTWHMGERNKNRGQEADALRYGLDLGIRLIDTAEMYGDGGAEEVIAEAITQRRDQVFLVSKVYPHNASRSGVAAACERSLSRLRTDYIDLYLLHWPGSIPLNETFDAFHRLRDSGKIREFGVSNFDTDDLQEIDESEHALLGTNQVLYNLAHREAEWAVLPWCRQRDIPVMAYCPLGQGDRLLQSKVLKDIAQRHRATPAQIALAWLLTQDRVVVIPKSCRPERIKENYAATRITLSSQDLAELGESYPAPNQPTRLGMN